VAGHQHAPEQLAGPHGRAQPDQPVRRPVRRLFGRGRGHGSATRDAAEARYNIEVVQLAQSHRVASAKLEGAIGYTGSARLAVGDRDPVVIEIDADDTVHTIAEKINEADVAVTARVIDGRLVIQADETGEAHQLKFEGVVVAGARHHGRRWRDS